MTAEQRDRTEGRPAARSGEDWRARLTPRQQITRDALAATGQFITAQDLHARLRASGQRIGLTTVYRALQALADCGAADVARTGDGQRAYRIPGAAAAAPAITGHHHYLICRRCGAAAEVPQAALEHWVAEMSRRHGFTEVTHVAELLGTCPRCSAPAPATRASGLPADLSQAAPAEL